MEQEKREPRAITPLEIFITERQKVTLTDEKWDEGLEWILVWSRKYESMVQSILLCSVDFQVVKKDPETKKGLSLAYTYYDKLRMQIALDFDRLGGCSDKPNYALFLMYHEFMHNLLQHFTRKTIDEYRKKDANLVNIIIDFYCNDAALEMAKIKKEEANEYTRKAYALDGMMTEEELNKIGLIHEKEILDLAEKFGIKDKFTEPLNEMIEEEVLALFFESDKMKEYEKGQQALKQAVQDLLDKMKGNGNHEEIQKSFEEIAKEMGTDVDGIKGYIESKLQSEFEDASKSVGQGGNLAERHVKRNRKKIDVLNTFKIKNVIGKRLKKDTKRTYARPYRKSDDEVQIIRKGKMKLKGDKLVVAIDVSGSVSQADLLKIYAICNGYLSKNQGEMEVIFWSSCPIVEARDVIESVTDYNDLEKFKVHSDGGTVVEYLYKYLDEKFPKAGSLNFVNISDFYFGSFPKLPSCIKQAYHLAVEANGEEISRKHYPNAVTVLVRD